MKPDTAHNFINGRCLWCSKSPATIGITDECAELPKIDAALRREQDAAHEIAEYARRKVASMSDDDATRVIASAFDRLRRYPRSAS